MENDSIDTQKAKAQLVARLVAVFVVAPAVFGILFLIFGN